MREKRNVCAQRAALIWDECKPFGQDLSLTPAKCQMMIKCVSSRGRFGRKTLRLLSFWKDDIQSSGLVSLTIRRSRYLKIFCDNLYKNG